MATVDEEDVPPVTATVADRFGHIWEEAIEVPVRVVEKATAIAYGGHSRSVWPLLLSCTTLVGLMVPRPVARLLGAIALLLMVVWLASRDAEKELRRQMRQEQR